MNINRHLLDEKTEKSLNQLGEMIVFIEKLIEECLDGTKPNEAAIPLLMHRNLLQKADAIHASIESGIEEASKTIIRTLYENYIYLTYILHSDTAEKSKAYYLNWYKSRKSLLLKLKSGHKKAPVIQSFLGETFYEQDIDSNVQKEIDEIERKIKSPWLKDMNKRWNKAKNASKNKYITWYSLFGHHTIRDVSIAVGLEAVYELLYPVFSEEVHANNSMELLERIEDSAYFKPLRAYRDPETILIMTTSYLSQGTTLLLENLFPDKLLVFQVYSMHNQESLHIIQKQLDMLNITEKEKIDRAIEIFNKVQNRA